jgi:2-desacetyl-2-hydroxyethyl bacteriochlorophyllide A dehydrogenase
MIMKAMVLRAPGDIMLEDVEIPRTGAGQIVIRVTHTGVCGTDLKIYNGAIPVQYPRIMGHEVVGEVVDCGENASVRSGDRVIVDPMVFCGVCFHCRIGQTNLCPNGMVLGRDANGGFAQYIAAPAANVFHLGPSITSQTAPLIQVATTCLHAQRLTKLFPGESVVVMGLGVTGQLHVQLAKARGASPIIGITRSVFKSRLAQQLGADITFQTGAGVVQEVLQATSGRGADLIIETTGKVSSLADAIKMARLGGRLLLFGINTAKEGSLPFYELYFKELALFNARAAKGEDYAGSIDLVRRGTIRLEPLITHTLPFHELRRGIEMIGSDLDERLKVILEH